VVVKPRRRLRRRILQTTLAILLVCAALVGYGVSAALSQPGNDKASAKIAEWARDHHLGSMVNWMEKQSYTPPKVNGTPDAHSPLVAPPEEPAPASVTASKLASYGPQLPGTVTPPATPPLATEGQWQMLAATPDGHPAMAATFMRPDAEHTSYTAGVVWWNPALVKAALHPGTLDPGGDWSQLTYLPPAQRSGVLAAFNSGFRLDDSKGGYYADGRVAKPLVDGAASMVFYQDGTMTIGQWGRDIAMSANIAAVRQNLALIVEDGAMVPGVQTNDGNAWGATLGNAKYVWRSGIGTRPDGGMVYVAGNRLTAGTLADLLVRAGSVRGMELDINPYWTSFVTYMSGTPTNLLPDMEHAADRYDTPSSRDFVSLATR